MTSAEPGKKAPYSSDIRWRIVWQRMAIDLPYWKIARNLNISVGTAYNVLKAFESSGEVSCNPPQDRRDSRSLTSSEEMFVVGLVFENPCLYLRARYKWLICVCLYNMSTST